MSGDDDDTKGNAAKEPTEEELEKGTVDQLSNDISLDSKDERDAAELDNLDLERERFQQANAMRGRFFRWGLVVTSLCIVTSCGLAIVLTFQRELTTGIATAFITGLTVEIIGVTAIIAKYLFPNASKSQKD